MFLLKRRPHPQATLETDLKYAKHYLIKKIGSGAFGNVYRALDRETGEVVAIKIVDLEDSQDDIASITREIHALAHGITCPQLINYYGSKVTVLLVEFLHIPTVNCHCSPNWEGVLCSRGHPPKVIGTKLWIAMEFVDGGTVLDKCPIVEEQVCGWLPNLGALSAVNCHRLPFKLELVLLKRIALSQYIAIICREILLGLAFLSEAGKIHRDIKAANVLLSHFGHVKLADFGTTTNITDTNSQCNTFAGRWVDLCVSS